LLGPKIDLFEGVVWVIFWLPPRRPKKRPRGPKTRPRAPKEAPRGRKEHPRWLQEGLKRPLRAGQQGPRPSKIAPRGSKDTEDAQHPKEAPGASPKMTC